MSVEGTNAAHFITQKTTENLLKGARTQPMTTDLKLASNGALSRSR
jgi:hypothetical protein